jgi:hypothetical protein
MLRRSTKSFGILKKYELVPILYGLVFIKLFIPVNKKRDKKEKIGVFRILAYACPKGDKNLLSSLQASYCA